MASVAVKLFSGGDVRRTRVGANAPFADLLAAAQDAYGTDGTLSWKDEDDDKVNIRGDADWSECVSSTPTGKVVRVHFTAAATAAAEQADLAPANADGTSTAATVPAPVPAPAVEIEVVDDSNPTPEEQRMPEGSDYVLGEIAAPSPAAGVKEAAHANPPPAPAPAPAIHYGVECDVSGETPIAGRRFHLIGHNYDLNEAEFNKLPEEHKALYEVIDRPGATPRAHGDEQGAAAEGDAVASAQAAITAALEQSGLIAHPMVAAHIGMIPHVLQHVMGQAQQAQSRCHGFRQGCGGGGAERTHIAAGEVLPAGSARRGAFGPGVVQIQHTLVKLGAMPASAIRCRAGFYGRHTAEAVRQFRLKEGIPGTEEEAGAYTDAVRAKLLAHLELQDQANAEADALKSPAPTPAPAPTQHRHAVREGSPYPVVLDENEVVVRAWYGNPSHAFDAAHGRDVTAQANGPDAPSLVASNDVWGDTAVGVRKALIVETATAAVATPAPAAESPGKTQEKWGGELQTLGDMGFTDVEENVRLLELHNGAMPFVIGGLI